MVNPNLTNSLAIQTLGQRDDNAFPFGANELLFDEFEHTTHVLGSLVSEELSDDLDVVLFGFVFDGDFLVEEELVGSRCGDFIGDGVSSEFEVDFAGELDFEGQTQDAQGVGVHLHFPFN